MDSARTTALATIESRELAPRYPHTLTDAVRDACSLPTVALTSLCQSIEHATEGKETPIVQFVSAYTGEGVSHIAFETAVVASTLMGRRVLYVDATDGNHQVKEGRTDTIAKLENRLHDLLGEGKPYSEALKMITGDNLTPTILRRYGEHGNSFTPLSDIEEMFESLRHAYDLVIIISPALMDDAFGAALSNLVDGSIMIVEAERTRGPVVSNVIETIEKNGGKVIGSVLNKRRYYIPQWLYKLLYR